KSPAQLGLAGLSERGLRSARFRILSLRSLGPRATTAGSGDGCDRDFALGVLARIIAVIAGLFAGHNLADLIAGQGFIFEQTLGQTLPFLFKFGEDLEGLGIALIDDGFDLGL